jgi:hypothetical protein
MKNNMEKRACERWNHTALIAFSYFNQEPSFDTQTLNHCLDGMCFKSSFSLQPDASLCIRVEKSIQMAPVQTYPRTYVQ